MNEKRIRLQSGGLHLHISVREWCKNRQHLYNNSLPVCVETRSLFCAFVFLVCEGGAWRKSGILHSAGDERGAIPC